MRGVRGVFGALKSARLAGEGAIAWPGDRAGVWGFLIEPGVCGAPNGVTGPTEGGPPGVRGLYVGVDGGAVPGVFGAIPGVRGFLVLDPGVRG